jgi:hypothetical protein
MLNWLKSESTKDDVEIKNYKKKIISEIIAIKKDDLFTKPKKITLWEKIKIMILGY